MKQRSPMARVALQPDASATFRQTPKHSSLPYTQVRAENYNARESGRWAKFWEPRYGFGGGRFNFSARRSPSARACSVANT